MRMHSRSINSMEKQECILTAFTLHLDAEMRGKLAGPSWDALHASADVIHVRRVERVSAWHVTIVPGQTVTRVATDTRTWQQIHVMLFLKVFDPYCR